MRKRIAVWIHGGLGTGHFSQGYPALEYLLKELARSYNIVVYSKAPPNPDYEIAEFPIRSAPATISTGWLRWIYLAFYFYRDNKGHKFDRLFAFWGYPTGFVMTCVALLTRIPVVIYLLGHDAAGIASINFGIFHKRLQRRLARWTYNRATQLLAISGFQKHQLELFDIRKDIKVIPWGLPAVSDNPNRPGGVLKIIHVGHLAPVKDQVTLIKTFALILQKQPAELQIFGIDTLAGAIQHLCVELGVSAYVKFMGMAPHPELMRHLVQADLMIHTSISEGQSMAMTEALASGVLVAGTRVGLLYDVGDRCAVIAEIGDADELATKILSLFDHPGEWRSRVENALIWSRQHDMAWTVRQITESLDAIS